MPEIPASSTPSAPPVPTAWSAPVLVAVAAGGALGATIRYAVTTAWAGPWAVFAINVLGCLLMGALLAVTERGAHPLVRPFLGTGMLGGFTTVSTYAVLSDGLIARQPLLGVGYLVLTPVAAVAAAAVGTLAGRALAGGPAGRAQAGGHAGGTQAGGR